LIVVCEPQCKAFSHEKFNSGFLYGLRLAFPEERLCFYGDASHIDSLRKILAHDKVSIENIEYVPVRFRIRPGILRLIGYQRLLSSVLSEVRSAGSDKVFFLSFNPEILYSLKRLKQKIAFRTMKFTLVLHGGFESIADGDVRAKAEAPSRSFRERGIVEKIRRTKLADLPAKALTVCLRAAERAFSPWHAISRRFLTETKMLLWKHSDDFRYICLSPHVRLNARRYLDVERLNFHTVTLPMVFADITPRPHNEFAKFAMFGYGDSLALGGLLTDLASRKIDSPYEIRVVGMDNRGIEGFAHVTCPSPGKPLERSDMESYAMDIDMFLILYDKTRYRLSCSGSILESLSYLKPVLHLDNECVNSFNKEKKPIGIRCDSLHMLADKLQEIVEGYADYGPVLDVFRENMLEVRRACSVEKSVGALRASFTW
jgi:hypothetical protein